MNLIMFGLLAFVVESQGCAKKYCKIRMIGTINKCIKWSKGKRSVPIEKELENIEPLVLDVEQHKEDTDDAGLHSWAPAGKNAGGGKAITIGSTHAQIEKNSTE